MANRPGAAVAAQPLALTEHEREEIDANAKLTIRDLNAKIRALEEAEQLRQSTETALLHKRFSRGLGALGSWAAGAGAFGAGKSRDHAAAEAAARQLGAHRESIIWFLRQRLQETARTQQQMMETRLTREVEKNRSLLANARTPAAAPDRDFGHAGPKHAADYSFSTATALPGLPGEEDGKRQPAANDLTDEQRQMFEKGNQDMLKHFESTLDKVRYVPFFSLMLAFFLRARMLSPITGRQKSH